MRENLSLIIFGFRFSFYLTKKLNLISYYGILEAVKDGASYTDIEKATMKYIRENYKWTDAADEWFRDEIRKWAATK